VRERVPCIASTNGELKLKVVQTVEAGELRPTQACREYQIAESTLICWRHEVRLRGVEAAFMPLSGPTATPDYEARIAEKAKALILPSANGSKPRSGKPVGSAAGRVRAV